MSAVGDARKRLAGQYVKCAPGTQLWCTHEHCGYVSRSALYESESVETTAGRTAIRAAANHLADIPGTEGIRVWLDSFAGTYRAGGA